MTNTEKKATMQAIADRIGVSKNTVSIALNNRPGVSEELKRQIYEVSAEMNYIHKPNAKVATASGNILIVAPEYVTSDTLFYSKILWKIEKYAQSKNCTPVIYSLSREAEQTLQPIRNFNALKFSGILVLGVISGAYINFLKTLGTPLVLVDNFLYSQETDAVVAANVEGGYIATQHLIHEGHTDIGFIGSIHMTSSFFQRWTGFEKAMNDSYLPVIPKFNILMDSPLPVLLSDVEILRHEIQNMKDLPTAWFCANDRLACSLIAVLSSMKLRVPDDISIIGFDDIELAALSIPPLTTVQVDRSAMAQKAVDLLLDRMTESGPPYKISVFGKLIIRDSVKKLSVAKQDR